MTPNDSIISESESQTVEDNMETNFEFAFSNFPDVPSIEISRDTPIKYIAQRFRDDCQKQMIVGDRQTGKTNLLSQFVRQYSDYTISYFITPNPLSQEIHTFLLSLSQQISNMLEKQPPDHQITLENLKSLFTQLYQNLRERARSRKVHYYIVIDGLEWSVKGKEGDRIIDLFPLQTFSYSPYLLCSCRPEEVTIIPQHAEYEVIDPKLWAFDDMQAEAYFKDVFLSLDKIKKINAKYGGSPGYLKIVKDTIQVDPEFDIESAPKDLDSLFNQQVETVFKTSTQIVRDALEFLAVSPVPLLAGTLSKLLDTEARNLIKNLRRTGLIGYDSQQGRLGYLNELTKEIVKAGLDKRSTEIVQRLLEYIEANVPDEDVLIDLLLRELDDYNGFQERLQVPAVIKTLSDSKTVISGIIKKYQTAFEMAQQHNDYGGLIKWSLGINAAKSFVLHAINQDEINALISIGEFEKALKRVYALPEVTSKIRLLARTYTSMKERGEDIPKDAIASLREMVKNLNIKEIEKELAQEIAIDLFPVLHDEAISLMEGVIGQVEKQGIVETTIEAVSANLQEQAEENLVSAIRDRMSVGDANYVISEWLRGLTYEKLGQELKTVKNTRAKEYIIRQWCRQNQEDENIVQAIYEWQNVIIHGDRTFVMPLRSLRHITELIIKLPVDERKGLIDALKVPEFTSIDSPKEEWVRVRLNLAKAQFEINSERAQEEIQETHENVLKTVTELDEKVFCFARLLLTVSQIMPHNASLIDTLERQFQEAFDSLLKDSADHFELIRGVIPTLVERDPEVALIVATQLNTQFRQVRAVRLVLRAVLQIYGEEDVSTLMKDALQFLEEFDETQRDNALLNMLREFGAKEYVLAQPNLETLYEFSQKINALTLKPVVLGNLAALYEKVSPDHAVKIVEQAIEAWRNENDLKAKLSEGYSLVKSISKIAPEHAKDLCQEVQGLHLQPQAILAAGSLGVVYREVLDLAIRAIDHKTFRDADETLRLIEHSIQRIPAKVVQTELYAQLAASAYRCDCTQYAKQIVRTKIIPQIKETPPGADRNTMLDFSLPVIFEYDQSEAKELVKDMSIIRKSLAWNSVVLWSICRSYLGDHEHVSTHTLRVTCDSSRLKNIVIAAASEITNDELLCDAIEAISNSIRASFNEDVIDQGRALDLLRILENVALEKLPDDERNIKHKGYQIVAQAVIHGVRSYIFRCLERAKRKTPRGLTKHDIRRMWEGIISEAHNIPNIADRVFVLALIARHYRYFYDKERARVKEVLELADEQAQKIPTLLDRLSRFEVIGEAWDNIQETKHVRYVIEKAFESVQLLKGSNADQQLRLLVQTAYKLNSTLAEELVAKLDKNRYPNEIDNPASITFQEQCLVKDPSKLELQGSTYTRENILRNSSQQLMWNLVSGMDNPRDTSILEQWMAEAVQYHPRIIFDVTHWVLENLHRKRTGSLDRVQPEVFVYAAELAFRLAEQISPAVREGLPIAAQESFPVLNKKIMSFSTGESEYAQKWLQNWLGTNVKEYLKICDPFFRKNELDYLKYLPENSQIKVFVITTDKYLDMSQGSDYLREELRAHWQSISSRSLPNALFLVVPKKLKDSFHDRAIITLHAGLNIGQSLNGLGKSRGNITILNEEEAKELENTYIQNMLNSGNWFMEHGVSPVMFRLRE